MKLSKKDTIVFVGDSITDANRNYQAIPAGWSSWGDGYVHLINAFTTAFHPELQLMIVNQGVSGDRVIDLEKRWDKDVLAFQPDWVTVMIGVNDVWRYYDATFRHENQVDLSTFQSTARKLLEESFDKLPNLKGIILLSAFMVEPNPQHPMRAQLAAYNQALKDLVAEFPEGKILWLDTQLAFDRFMQEASEYVLSSDRVHPSTAGHLLIAKTWLEGVGLSWN